MSITEHRPRPVRKAAPVWIGKLPLYLLLFVGGVVMMVPFYFMFVFATHDRTTIFSFPPPLWFGDQLEENIQKLLLAVPFGRTLWNSIYLAVMSTVTTLFFCSLAGYGFAMYRFKGREMLFRILMLTMLIPPLLNLIPFYLVIQSLGWVNEPKALYIPSMAGAFGIFLVKQYMSSAIPRELVEAGRIDGATEFGIYWRIVLPLCKPVLATLGLITFIGSWNSFQYALIILREPQTYNVQLSLRSMQALANTEWGALMAGIAIAVLPLLVLFSLAARQLIQGLAAGSVKG